MIWDNDYCTVCDKMCSHGSMYCSESCRLSEVHSAQHDKNSHNDSCSDVSSVSEEIAIVSVSNPSSPTLAAFGSGAIKPSLDSLYSLYRACGYHHKCPRTSLSAVNTRVKFNDFECRSYDAVPAFIIPRPGTPSNESVVSLSLSDTSNMSDSESICEDEECPDRPHASHRQWWKEPQLSRSPPAQESNILASGNQLTSLAGTDFRNVLTNYL